jgi:hypothetical protein
MICSGYKIEDIQSLADGTEIARVYETITDLFGNVAWLHTGRVRRRKSQTWAEAIDAFCGKVAK